MDIKDDINEVETLTGKYLTPFQRKLLQKSLQDDLPDTYRQRIQIMLLADEGKYQIEICRILGCCPATVRHWTHIARAGMAHQWQECPIGRHKTVSDRYLERLQELVNHSPRDYGYCFRRWTANWLCKHLAKELGIEVSDRHLTRLLKQMGLSTRPKKTQDEESTDNKNQSSKISIQDLKTIDPLENPEPLSLNLTNLDTDSYGAKSIRSVSVVATSPEDFGISSFRSRSSTLSHTS
jgi:transposase